MRASARVAAAYSCDAARCLMACTRDSSIGLPPVVATASGLAPPGLPEEEEEEEAPGMAGSCGCLVVLEGLFWDSASALRLKVKLRLKLPKPASLRPLGDAGGFGAPFGLLAGLTPSLMVPEAAAAPAAGSP